MSDHKPTPSEIAMAEAAGLTVQPDPVKNDFPSAHDLLIAEIEKHQDNPDVHWGTAELQLAVIALIPMYISLCGGKGPAIEEVMARKAFGLEKYGTLLQPFNGRDALADANDEFGDLLAYLTVALFEAQAKRGSVAVVSDTYEEDNETGWG